VQKEFDMFFMLCTLEIRLNGVQYAYDIDFLDLGNENEAKLIKLDPIMISKRNIMCCKRWKYIGLHFLGSKSSILLVTIK
jgi:hypothetical protein